MADKNEANNEAASPDSSEQLPSSEVVTEAEATEQQEPETPVTQGRPSRLPMLLVLFLLFPLLAASAGLAWLGHEKAADLDARLQQLTRQLEQQPNSDEIARLDAGLQALQTVKERQQDQDTAFKAQQDQLRQHQEAVRELHEDLLKASEPKPRDWQLAEVEYLLRLANQRLQLEEDIEGALTLFRTASVRLQQAQVPGTLAVRQALQDNIETLEALEPLDRVSLALQLQRLADRAARLEVQPLSEAPTLDGQALKPQGEGLQTWYERLWQEIKSLVVIRTRELPLDPLPYAEDERLLKQQLASLLNQAAWAGLRGKEALYQQSLEGVALRLQAFDLEDATNLAFQTELKALQQISVSKQLPSVETSLDRLQNFIAERYGRLLPVPEEGVE